MAKYKQKFLVGKGGKKTLPGLNIYIGRRRTTVRLSPVEAAAIKKIAEREGCGLGEIYTYIDRRKQPGVSRATAIREFALQYFIEAGTPAGHRKAGHGNLIRKARRLAH